MWIESEENVVNILGHDFEYLDEDADGRYTAVCSTCGAEHSGLEEHLQIPNIYCVNTNLWTALKPEKSRRTATAWVTDYYSVTFPVEAGDRIWANSIQAAGSNDHTANGIRITWFHDDGRVTSFDANTIYAEFSKNVDESSGKNYITAPDSAMAICVTMWKNNSNSAIYVLNEDHPYEHVVTEPTCGKGYTTHTCTACGDEYVDSYTDPIDDHKFTNYISNGDATKDQDGTKTAVCDYGCGTENTVVDEGSSDIYKALQGKVISIMGDSISTFAGWIPTADGFNLEHDARYPQDNLFNEVTDTWWYQLIFDELDAQLGVNESWRSTEIGNVYDVEVNSGYEGTKACMASMTRIQNLGSNGTPDLILFYGGTNDITQRNNADIPRVRGSFDESMVPEEVDLEIDMWDTVIEAYVTALMRMNHFYPDARIVCMFPTVTRNNSETVVSGYNTEFKKVCDYFIAEGYDIVYLDLLESGVTIDHLPDGTHPNAEGMDLITAAVKSKILETCEDMTAGEHIVHSVTHTLSHVKGSKSYYKGLSDGKTFIETLTGDDVNVTVTMGSEDITAAVCTYNDDKSEAYINVTDVSDDLAIIAEGTYDPSSLYGDRLQSVPENICSGFNLLEQLNLDSGYFKEGAWDTSKYYSLTISVNPGDKIWATSFQAAGLNGATSSNGVRIAWFKNDGSVTEVESEDVYDEFVLNKYITVPEDTAVVSIPLRTDSEDNAVYIMGLDHAFVEENNGNGTETLTCSICGHEITQLIGKYLEPYIQMIPEKTYNTTNLWTLLESNQKYYKTTVNETKNAYDKATWGVNGSVQSVTIPVGSGYKIYSSSLVATKGIRITWFFEDETFVSWAPTDAHAYFTKNTDETTGLHYIAPPEGAIAVNVSMWDNSDANTLYVLNLPVDPLTLHGLPSHLRDLPEPCYNTTNIWAELEEAGKLDEKYWNGTTWGTTGQAKSVTVRVNGGDIIKANSFGTSEGNKGIRVTWFLSDGSTPLSMGKDEVYKEYTDNGYLTAPENAVAVCVPMWAANESCEFYNLSLSDDPILAHGLSDHLVDLPEPCYNDTNIWAELAKAEKLDLTYWNGSTWGTTDEAKSVTVRVNGGDKIKANSFGTSEGNNGIRVTWFLDDGSMPKSMAKGDVYTEYTNNGYLTAPENAIAVCVPMWVARENSEFYNLSLPDRPLSGVENYNGKVISIMGDSISTFAGYTPVNDGFNLAHRNRYPQSNLSMDVNETWWMQVLTELDAKLGINDSWAGSKVNNTSDTNSGDKGPDAAMASLTRIQNLGANGTPDVILVFGGTNDRGSTLGSFDAAAAPAVEDVDLESYKWDNFVDAYVAMITRMMHFYPDAEIVAMMPYMPNAASMNVEIAKICDHYGIEYTDLMECGIQITTEHLPDDLHPNAAGFDYITDAVLDVLLNDVDMTEGEHTVYPITHELTNATATKHYYKGVSSGARFEETISSEATANVTVTMGGADITESAYNKETGVIEIESVTGEIVVTVSAEKTMADRIQELPEVVYRDTNLWAVLTPQPEYYGSSNTWESGIYSITIPVTAGDQIWATAFGSSETNGGGNNGIRVTWFTEDYSVLESVGPADVHSEFVENGYLTVPENAKYVNIPAWKTVDFTNVVNILNLPTVYDEYLIDLDLDSICSNTDVWDLLKDEWNTKYWNSGWIVYDDVRSITIPIRENDQIKANVFGTTVTSGGASKKGIRVTWFDEAGVLKSEYVSEGNGNLSDERYVTAPVGAIAVNLPVWDSKVENDMYILTLDHSYTGDWVITEEGHARKCGSCDAVDPEIGNHIDEDQDCLCDECGYEMGIPEHTHEYEVTYTGDGRTSYIATRFCECEDVQTTEAAITVTITKEATCTEEGEKTYNATFSVDWAVSKVTTEVIPMIEHDYKSVITEPTCTEDGYTTYSCTCGDSYKDDYVDALGHIFVDGSCTVCGEEESTTGAAITLSGSAVSWNDTDNAVYLLYDGDVDDATIRAEWMAGNYTALTSADKGGITSTTLDGKNMKSQNFVFDDVEAGTYKVAILKPGKYIPKIVEVTIDGSDVNIGQQKLWLYGDVNYDGIVKANDGTQITRKVNRLSSIFDTGDERTKADRLLAADVISDGLPKANDSTQITRYVNRLSSIFDTFK